MISWIPSILVMSIKRDVTRIPKGPGHSMVVPGRKHFLGPHCLMSPSWREYSGDCYVFPYAIMPFTIQGLIRRKE
jgi:hypothetical protein